MQRQRGFTLLELLVVLAIIGLGMSVVSLSLRDNSQTQLEREAQRLIAVLEAARAQSRTSGVPLVWQTNPNGFAIRSSSASSPLPTRTHTWLAAGTHAVDTPADGLVLGPEPLIAPARLGLRMNATTLHIGTDGLRPFQVVP